MFAKILAPGTSGFIGLSGSGDVTLSSAHPQQQATWEIIDPLQTGKTSLTSGMLVTIKSTTDPGRLLEWFTDGSGGVRTTRSLIPTPTTKFVIQMPGSSPGTVIPHGANITLSAKPANTATGLIGFLRGLLSIFTGTPPARYLSTTATGLALVRLTTPGPTETFKVFQAPLISGFTITPVPVRFQSTATATSSLSFLFSIPPGGATVDLKVNSGSRFLANFAPHITVPAGVLLHSLQFPLSWGFRSCEKLSVDASTVMPFVATRSEVIIADFMDQVPFFSMTATPDVIEVTAPPTPVPISIQFTYDTTKWPSGSDNLDMILTMNYGGVVSQLGTWSVTRAMPTSQPFSLNVTPTRKDDCISFTVDFKFTNAGGVGGREGIVVRVKTGP